MAAAMASRDWTSADAMQLVAAFALVARRMTTMAGVARSTAVFADMRALSVSADQSSPRTQPPLGSSVPTVPPLAA